MYMNVIVYLRAAKAVAWNRKCVLHRGVDTAQSLRGTLLHVSSRNKLSRVSDGDLPRVVRGCGLIPGGSRDGCGLNREGTKGSTYIACADRSVYLQPTKLARLKSKAKPL